MSWTVNQGRVANAEEAPPNVAPYWDGESFVHETASVGVQPIATAANRRPVGRARAGRIGGRCVIRPYAIIYAGVILGADTIVADRATIRENSIIGNRCVIGCLADIQYDVRIGDDVRILNETQIAGGTIIGDGTFVGPGVQTANDPHVAHFDLGDYRDRGQIAPVIGRKVFIGVGAILLPGVRIGDGAVVAAGAVVTKDVAAGEKVYGMPARTRLAGDVARKWGNGEDIAATQFIGR